MALSRLLEAIERDVRSELAADEAASRREAEAIAGAAAEEARQLEAAIAGAIHETVAAEREASLGEGRLQAARALRSARARAYDETLDAVRTRLAAVRDDPLYPRVLAALVAECRSALPDGQILRVDPRDESLVRGLDDDLTVEHTLSTWGGCELDDEHGRVARNTLEQRLAAAEPELRRLLAAPSEPPDAAS